MILSTLTSLFVLGVPYNLSLVVSKVSQDGKTLKSAMVVLKVKRSFSVSVNKSKGNNISIKFPKWLVVSLIDG